ncbi:MAG TPA: hypothetical protein VLM85_07770 [Polyangiaceae bacterium]|nr:hypothetical protein [Polyangiaceae bacterium]
MAWVLGGGAAVGMAMIAASLGACSSGPVTTTDAGKDVTTADTGKQDTGTSDTGTTPDTGIQDAGADCKNVPGSFPFSTEAGPYCPYQADGAAPDCVLGDHCCIYSQASALPSTCNAANTACTPGSDAGTTDFQCEETNDCTGTNQVCCLNAPAYLAQDPGCTAYQFVKSMKGTSCMANCGTQPQICGANSDCPQGKTCQPVNTKGIWIGACQ